MADKTIKVETQGSGWFMLALFLVFLVLKLTGVITWSWWWITAPLWLGWVVIIAIFGIVGVYLMIKTLFGK